VGDGPVAVRPTERGPTAVLPQFLARAIAIIVGLTMLLVVNVRGVAFYVAWSLIVLAFLSELGATLVYWRRARASRR
jgi:hypothetical protein